MKSELEKKGKSVPSSTTKDPVDGSAENNMKTAIARNGKNVEVLMTTFAEVAVEAVADSSLHWTKPNRFQDRRARRDD